MDTLGNMRKALEYIEENLTGKIENGQIAKVALCSEYHFQRMFVFLIGIPLSKYIRRRRLTLAALELQNTEERILDIAVKYGYSSSDAFSRAFGTMHGPERQCDFYPRTFAWQRKGKKSFFCSFGG